MDCDGVVVGEDCDDFDIVLGSMSTDQDCDGWLTLEDCDDNDVSAYPGQRK